MIKIETVLENFGAFLFNMDLNVFILNNAL